MGKLFHCEIEFMPSPHLMQLYAGFFKLQQEGVIDLVLRPKKYIDRSNPIVHAVINKRYKVVYDTQDGLIWINDSVEKNLNHFQQNYRVDFYFKRSYHPQLQQYRPSGCNVYPLGFNYNVHPDENLIRLTDSTYGKFKYFVKTNPHLKKIFKKRFFYAKDFEYYPIKNPTDKILFLTRVWNPESEDVTSKAEHLHRIEINDRRVRYLDICKKKFGDRFTGGLWMDDFSCKYYKDYVLPFSQTNKSAFLQQVKEHTICIATTGLFNSIGWKMGEYVAASRAIVSEPLHFEVPGGFTEGQHYFEFNDEEILLQQIDLLLSNKELLIQIMNNNYHYYNNYLKPDILVLNTLVTIANHE